MIINDVCPECGGKVVRGTFSDYGFCQGDCNIALSIPADHDSDKKIGVLRWGTAKADEEIVMHKMTREHFNLINANIKMGPFS